MSSLLSPTGQREELLELRRRLEEAEELLEAIRTGVVDALIVGATGEEHIYTLEGAEHPYRVLVESMQEGAATMLPDGTVLYCNRSLSDLIGVSLEDVIGETLHRYVAPADQAIFEQLLKEAIRGKARMEVVMQKPDGSSAPVLLSASALELSGTPSICLVVTDLSLQKRTEALEAQVQARTLALSDANRELQSFAYVASHDLQEPLRKIQTFINLLASDYNGRFDEQADFYLKRIDAAAGRMSSLVNDLLMFSRVATEQRPFQEFDLTEVAREVVVDFDLAISESGGSIEVDELPAIEADRAQVRQVLTNLVSNAVKFRQKDQPPHIRISGVVSADRNSCILKVQDNGIGFEQKFADRIFEPFQRLHGRREYPGTGMGLAIVRRIVDRHNGRIKAESAPGEGSTFTIELPVTPEIETNGKA